MWQQMFTLLLQKQADLPVPPTARSATVLNDVSGVVVSSCMVLNMSSHLRSCIRDWEQHVVYHTQAQLGQPGASQCTIQGMLYAPSAEFTFIISLLHTFVNAARSSMHGAYVQIIHASECILKLSSEVYMTRVGMRKSGISQIICQQ